MKVRYELHQDGMMVACVEAEAAVAWREIMHYASQYLEDGEVTIRHIAENHPAYHRRAPIGE